LGAQPAVSAAFVDNPAWIAVSRTLGYQSDAVQRDVARGELRDSQRFRLTRAALAGAGRGHRHRP
jgi:hypothetical protein